ncbi:hypothetical protein Sfr7A_25490 [Streptomyces xinghaiensis]|uniref:Uncharacterized protein n=2 Tax=Streptomyces TaxID=1883 RepID=A0A3M8EX64_9ACTN|nr:hypothetical protein Sfr7A_25490 [Streptomyces xinghaiensis]RKM92496.1 hypothetical protein SFRA_024145 [Streptomyces xinghaiensis]RNC70463.1 hypothetical protein DC095_025135 [Streptomyces xinghaiensis]
MVLAQGVLVLLIVVMAMTSGLLLISHGGPSFELVKVLAVLAVLIALLVILGRRTTDAGPRS